MNSDLIQAKEAAEYLKVSAGYLYVLCKKNKIEHIKIGKLYLFKKKMLDDFISKQTVEKQEKEICFTSYNGDVEIKKDEGSGFYFTIYNGNEVMSSRSVSIGHIIAFLSEALKGIKNLK